MRSPGGFSSVRARGNAARRGRGGERMGLWGYKVGDVRFMVGLRFGLGHTQPIFSRQRIFKHSVSGPTTSVPAMSTPSRAKTSSPFLVVCSVLRAQKDCWIGFPNLADDVTEKARIPSHLLQPKNEKAHEQYKAPPAVPRRGPTSSEEEHTTCCKILCGTPDQTKHTQVVSFQ
jgi:hypothetical protein